MNTKFMILLIKVTISFLDKFKIFGNFFLFNLFALYLTYTGDRDLKLKIEKDFEYIKYAKKGSLLVTYKYGGKSHGIEGKIVEIGDTTIISVDTKIYGNYLVKSMQVPEIGQLYPVWYSDDLEMVRARTDETREGTIKIYKKLYSDKFLSIPGYYVISFWMILLLIIDVIRLAIKKLTCPSVRSGSSFFTRP